MMPRVLLALALVLTAMPAAHGEAGEGDSKRRITSSEAYVPSATLSAAITKGYQYEGLLVVDCGLDIPDPKLRAQVARMTPRLTDALRAALAEYTYARYRAGAAPDPDRIAAMLQQAADTVIGAPGARLLLANVMVQRGR